MAKHKHSKKPKVNPNKSVLRRKVSDKAKIEELIRAQPNWWDMKTKQWMPLVMELLGLKQKPRREDDGYRAAHDFINNERRKRASEKKRKDQQAREDIKDQIEQDNDLDFDNLGAAEQLEVMYEESVEGAEPIQDLVQSTFNLP